MSNLIIFLRENKRKKPNFKYAPTKDFTDENGEAVEFEFKHISTAEEREIRESCTIGGEFKSSLYTKKFVARSVVFPDLLNKELQDSYGVYTPEDLLEALVDNPAEYLNMTLKVQQETGLISLDEAIEAAKN